MRTALVSRETAAFSIPELETALRLAELIRNDGYRLAVCIDYPGAEELLVVSYPGLSSPVFAIRPSGSTVTLIDAAGLTLSFPTLEASLRAMLPYGTFTSKERFSRRRPECLQGLPGFLTGTRRGLWSWCQVAVRTLCRCANRQATP